MIEVLVVAGCPCTLFFIDDKKICKEICQTCIICAERKSTRIANSGKANLAATELFEIVLLI